MAKARLTAIAAARVDSTFQHHLAAFQDDASSVLRDDPVPWPFAALTRRQWEDFAPHERELVEKSLASLLPMIDAIRAYRRTLKSGGQA